MVIGPIAALFIFISGVEIFILIKKKKLKFKRKRKLPVKSKKRHKPSFKKTPSISSLIDKDSFIDKIEGIIHIESINKVDEKNGEKIYLLKLLLTDYLTSVMVNIEGKAALEVLKLIKEGVHVILNNVSVKFNSIKNEKELIFTKDSFLEIL